MITIIQEEVVKQCNRIRLFDPHQLATPCWMMKPFSTDLNFTGEKTMPIKVIELSAAPARKVFRTPAVPEIQEVLDALKKATPKQAIEVTMSKETELRYSKNRQGKLTVAAKVFASALKRRFIADGLPLTAYSPDGKLVYVVKDLT